MPENVPDLYDELLDIVHAFALDNAYVSEPASNPDGYRYEICIGKSNSILFKTPEAASKLAKLLHSQSRIIQEAAKNVEAITERMYAREDLNTWRALSAEEKKILRDSTGQFGRSAARFARDTLRAFDNLEQEGLVTRERSETGDHVFVYATIKGRRVLNCEKFDS